MSDDDAPQPITNIRVSTRSADHTPVLRGTSGTIARDAHGKHLFVAEAGSVVVGAGPQEGTAYSVHFELDGHDDRVSDTVFVGYASHYQRYVFSRK